MENLIPSRLATLGHPRRLAIFRLLVRRYPDRVPAGELAAALDLRPSTLSSYLAALMQAGLVTQEREGTSLRYAIDMAEVDRTFDYLFCDCCRGRPALPARARATVPAGPGRKYNVLFICTGNSARSIFAEALLRREAGDRFEVHSAGTAPYSEINPFALDLLKRKGHDTSALRAKTVAELRSADAPRFDFVFTVCDQAANEDCPAWSGQPVTAHWGVPDPVCVTGGDAARSLAFKQAYGALANRIRAFAALPVDSLDRASLQKAIDEIGRETAGETA